MSSPRLRAALIVLASSLGLGACAYDGYGYGGGYASVGYGGYCDPYYDDCYGGGYGDPWYGWYDGYYYPGFGFYIYDQYRRPFRWNDNHRRYWESRRHRWGDRNWNDRRWERWDHWDRNRDGRQWRGDDGRRWRDRDGDGRWRDRGNRGDGQWRGRRWRGSDGGASSGSTQPSAAPRAPSSRSDGSRNRGRPIIRDPNRRD
ncbi:MAG TPA: hypothetical protein VD887_10915 [Allosphingosinicella sp.]|nr:hypothetical protein [Allosphingosinicella sp.]